MFKLIIKISKFINKINSLFNKILFIKYNIFKIKFYSIWFYLFLLTHGKNRKENGE
jgi:hypothetical protein